MSLRFPGRQGEVRAGRVQARALLFRSGAPRPCVGRSCRHRAAVAWCVCREDGRGGGFPELDRAVIAGRGENPAIGAELDAPDAPRVPFEDQQGLPAGRVPEPDGLVRSGRGEAAVGAEREAVDRVDVPLQDASRRAVAASHSRTVWSSDDVATVRPSGLNATALIRSVCPRSVTRGRLSARSQRMHVLS